MKALFKRIFIVFLILVTVGAVLVCSLVLMPAVDNMASNHDGLVSHIVYVKNLTSAITNTTFFVSIVVLFLSVVFAELIFSYKNDSSLLAEVQNYLKRKKRDYSYTPLSKLTYWLSLFESSPNSMKPA